jgi:hypothetical protein
MASLDLALGTEAHYGLKPDEARTIASEVSAALFGGTRDRLPPPRGASAGEIHVTDFGGLDDEKEGNCDHQPQLCCDSSTAATPPDDVLGRQDDLYPFVLGASTMLKLNYIYNLIHRDELSEQQIEALNAVVASLKRGVISP